MADKTTTLKTKTNDNVYPNIIGDNMDNAIVNSAHINHTLTKDHKINFRLDTNVSGLIFNSLQKPAGLTKTKLVGVGTNGQENIEIGDNLTLANGKLSASGGGGGGNFKQLYIHAIRIYQDYTNIWLQLTLDNNEPIDNLQKLKNALKIYLNATSGQSLPCSGSTVDSEAIVALYYNNDHLISYITLKYDSNTTYIKRSYNSISESWKISDTITIPRQTV